MVTSLPLPCTSAQVPQGSRAACSGDHPCWDPGHFAGLSPGVLHWPHCDTCRPAWAPCPGPTTPSLCLQQAVRAALTGQLTQGTELPGKSKQSLL